MYYMRIFVTDIMEYLYNIKIPEIQKAPTDKILPIIVVFNLPLVMSLKFKPYFSLTPSQVLSLLLFDTKVQACLL